MRALALLASFAGLALLLATAAGVPRAGVRPPAGWTGYAPLAQGRTVVCTVPSTGVTMVIKSDATGSGFFGKVGSVPIRAQGSTQMICRVP